MKKLSVLFALLAVAMIVKAQSSEESYTPEVDVVVDPFTIVKGADATILEVKVSEPLSTTYTVNVWDDDEEGYVEKTLTKGWCAYQFDIVLPAGVIVVGSGDDFLVNGSFRFEVPVSRGHTASGKKQDDGSYRFVVYHSSNIPFAPEETVLMKLEVKTQSKSVYGLQQQATVKNVVFASSGSGAGVDQGGYKPEVLNFDVNVVSDIIDYTLTDAGYGTLILPFAAEIPETLDWQAFTCDKVNGNTLVLSEEGVTALEAYTPYLIKGSKGTTTFVGIRDSEVTATSFGTALIGVTAATTITSGYVLQNQDGKGVAFYKVTDSKTVPAYRCYLDVASGALMYRIGGTTNIEEVTVDENADVYDVLGRKVIGPLQKGVYIKNGRKIYVK